MPGFLITLKKTFYIIRNNIDSGDKKINFFILSSALYVLFSSTLVAVPRYIFPFEIVFIVISISYWSYNIKLSEKIN